MKRPLFVALCLLLSLSGWVGNASAQYRRDGMRPDERREMREQMRRHWEQPPHRRDFQRDDERGRWQVPPEERRRMRDEMREQPRERRGYDERRW